MTEGRPVSGRSRGVVVLPEHCRERIRAHAAADYPHECCGLLVGTWQEGGRTVVERVEPARNLNTERAHDRYELDPMDYLRVDREAREAGLEVVGFYHSHPDSPPLPSVTDARQAWPAYTYIIVSVVGGEPEQMRAWVFDEAAAVFDEQEVAGGGTAGPGLEEGGPPEGR